jgi:hypothetical protein
VEKKTLAASLNCPQGRRKMEHRVVRSDVGCAH